jgi:hypothetical protein
MIRVANSLIIYACIRGFGLRLMRYFRRGTSMLTAQAYFRIQDKGDVGDACCRSMVCIEWPQLSQRSSKSRSSPFICIQPGVTASLIGDGDTPRTHNLSGH